MAMLPTPSTSHVDTNCIYEPAEDSFLLLDTLSAPREIQFLKERFRAIQGQASPTPLVLEVGTGSGVVLAFMHANTNVLFGRGVLTLGIDVNRYACEATRETIARAVPNKDPGEAARASGLFLGALQGDLTAAVRAGTVDVLVFNPPYVPTDEVPVVGFAEQNGRLRYDVANYFERDSHLLALSYAGGKDGMEVTNRLLSRLPEVLSKRGVAYILLCESNKPASVMARIREWGYEWAVESVGQSGRMGGWEKLQIVRIWRI